MSRDTDHSRSTERAAEERREQRAEGQTWLTSTILQTAVAIVGLVAVLFALGMAFGVDLLGMLAEVLSTQTGQWLAIAFVILLITGATIRALEFTWTPR